MATSTSKVLEQVKELKNTNKIVYFGSEKVGTSRTAGNACWYEESRMDDTKFWYVVPKDAVRKYWLGVQWALEGKEGVDFFKFKTAAGAAKKIESLK